MNSSLYYNLFETLYENQVRYLVCGGLAVNIYGITRMTADIDILLDFEKENLLKFEKCAKNLHYNSVVPLSISILSDEKSREKLMKTKNMAVYSYFSEAEGFMNLDVLI